MHRPAKLEKVVCGEPGSSGSGPQRGEARVVFPTHHHSQAPHLCFSCLQLWAPEVLTPRGCTLARVHDQGLTELQATVPPPAVPMRAGVTILARDTDPDEQEVELPLYHNRQVGWGGDTWNPHDSHQCPLVLPMNGHI